MVVEVQRRPLKSGAGEEARRRGGEEEKKRKKKETRRAMSKSNNPHLAGGEKLSSKGLRFTIAKFEAPLVQGKVYKVCSILSSGCPDL